MQPKDTDHQSFINSISGKIAQIYNNDELENNLKHDIVCRLIAKYIGANSVSILLYQGTKNKLVCAGRYLDPLLTNAESLSGESGGQLIEIMKVIDIIEFLKINKYQNSITNIYQLYTEYCEFYFSNPIKITFSEFSMFLKSYSDKKGKKIIDKNYEKYVTHIRQDQHSISISDPITGSYYYGLTHSENYSEMSAILSKFNFSLSKGNIISANLNHFPKSRLCSDNLSKKLKVKINTDAWYLGIPLLANNRPIGVFRLIIKKGLLEFETPHSETKRPVVQQYHFESNNDVVKYIMEIVNIESISLLLSLFIENLFFADGMRDISLKDALKGDINNLPGIANELTKVVNCFGSIIRLSDVNGRNASIQGYSNEVEDYVKLIKEIGDPYISRNLTFVPVLTELLYGHDKIIGEASIKIECLRIDFNEKREPSFSYLYLDEKSRLVSSNNFIGILNSKRRRMLKEIFSDKDSLFKPFDIKSILHIPIKDQEYGFVTFANTSHRTFINKDVEMLIPVVNRLGLALKYDSNIAKTENASKIKIQESQRVIYHQLQSPIVSMRFSFQNLKILRDRNEYSDFDNRITEIIDTLENVIDFISLNQYLSFFLIEGKIIPDWERISITRFIINKVRSYQVHAKYHRGIDIHVEAQEFMPNFLTDKKLLTHVMQALIDNAIKYSYSHHPRTMYSNDTNPIYTNTSKPNKIFVTISYAANEHIISIENWGCKITQNDYSQITGYMQRGDMAKKFEENGTGIGLFLVNMIVKALNGKLIIDSNDDHTKISLVFKNLFKTSY